MKKRIFTFWHDIENIPDYIKLCIESWKKYLPDFEIIILNYENLDKYIGNNFYDKSLYENFTLAQQTQAIRAADKRYGYKTDFIGQFGEEMYNFFTTKGFIHEPFDKENEWELTKLGLRAHIQFS